MVRQHLGALVQKVTALHLKQVVLIFLLAGFWLHVVHQLLVYLHEVVLRCGTLDLICSMFSQNLLCLCRRILFQQELLQIIVV